LVRQVASTIDEAIRPPALAALERLTASPDRLALHVEARQELGTRRREAQRHRFVESVGAEHALELALEPQALRQRAAFDLHRRQRRRDVLVAEHASHFLDDVDLALHVVAIRRRRDETRRPGRR
jgi:hypothetical protein